MTHCTQDHYLVANLVYDFIFHCIGQGFMHRTHTEIVYRGQRPLFGLVTRVSFLYFVLLLGPEINIQCLMF